MSFVEPFTATVENHNPYDVVVRVSCEGKEWRLGKLHSGERATFALPAEVSTRTRYYLVADRVQSFQRVVSDPIMPTRGIRPFFEVGRVSHTSYLRFLRKRSSSGG